MNSQEIQSKIDNLKNQIDKSRELVNKPDNVRWRADEKENYYRVNGLGRVDCIEKTPHTIEDFAYSTGNYFKTYEEAQDHKENLITKQKLKDLALRLNNGVEFDWENENQKKYFIYYTYYNNQLLMIHAGMFKYMGTIYCLNKSFLETAMQEIGEDTLIKLIKDGV